MLAKKYNLSFSYLKFVFKIIKMVYKYLKKTLKKIKIKFIFASLRVEPRTYRSSLQYFTK